MSAYLPTRRPFRVTLVYLGVTFIGVWNISKAWVLWQQRELLQQLAIQPNPIFQMIMALIWAVLFLGAVWGLRGKRPWLRSAIPILLVVYAGYSAAIKLGFAAEPATQNGWMWTTTATLLFAAYTGYALHKSTVYFSKIGEEQV
jgi:hypothetical protein